MGVVSLLKDEERQRCEVWTRVMGYHRPVSQFNIGKKAEHAERLQFQESRLKKSRKQKKREGYIAAII